MFKVDVIDIVMKDLINEYGNEKIVIYVNEENSVGFTGGTLGFLAQVASNVSEYIVYLNLMWSAGEFIKERFIDPSILKKSIEKRSEWSLNDFCEYYEIESYKRAGRLLRSCGYKKHEQTGNYRSKAFVEEIEIIDGVG